MMTTTNGTTGNAKKKPRQTSRRTFRQRIRSSKGSRKCQPGKRVYHGANNLRDMDGMHDAIINLARTAVANRETMMSQCKIIVNLTATVAALTHELQQANAVNNRGPEYWYTDRGKQTPSG